MTTVVDKVRDHVFKRRVRISDVFRDLDPLHKFTVTSSQFQRCLKQDGLPLSAAELAELATIFQEPGVMSGQALVNHIKFIQSVDEVFRDPSLIVKNSAGGCTPHEDVSRVLHRISVLCQTRGVTLKYSFKDFDRLNTGKVTSTQFVRGFPFDNFNEQDMMLLIKRYGDSSTGTLTVNYRSLHTDISDIDPPVQDALTAERKERVTLSRNEPSHWTNDSMSVIEKIRSACYIKGVKIGGFFKDWDTLNRGICTVGQLKCVFTLLGLDVDDCFKLLQQYEVKTEELRADALFNYKKFVSDVEIALSPVSLEMSPTSDVNVPNQQELLGARRNSEILSESERSFALLVERKVAEKVQVKCIPLLAACQSYDKNRIMRISKHQFSRVMAAAGLILNDEEARVVSKKYCNFGNTIDFNYTDFCNQIAM